METTQEGRKGIMDAKTLWNMVATAAEEVEKAQKRLESAQLRLLIAYEALEKLYSTGGQGNAGEQPERP